MVKHYLFAGIDLLLSKDNEIYFIEANSSPGVLNRYKKVYKHCEPIEE